MSRVRVAIVGVGNCASSLVQGGAYYRRTGETLGLIHPAIGPYRTSSVDFVLGIDIDRRKVGKPLAEAIFAPPNNTQVFERDLPAAPAQVIMGRILDGVAPHMTEAGERGFQPADGPEPTKADIVEALRRERVDVLINFLPVGS
jgi:myo-inositol-1-phosphate synthase